MAEEPQTIQRNTPGDQPRMTINTRMLSMGCAALAVMVVIGGAVAVLFFPPFNLAANFGMQGCQALNTGNPSILSDEGVTVTLSGSQGFQVCVDSFSLEALQSGQGGSDFAGALDAIPPYLQMKSGIYVVRQVGDGSATVEVSIPADAGQYESLDLYRWDKEARQWVFVPGHADSLSGLFLIDGIPGNVAIFQSFPVAPVIGTILEPGQVFDSAGISALNIVMPGGLTVNGDGTLAGALAGGWQLGAGYAVTPILRASDPALVSGILSNPATRAVHIDAIKVAVVQDGYTGIVIDYGALQLGDRESFTAFITELASALHGYNKLTIVRPATPVEVPGGYDPGGYDWRALGAVTDGIIVDPGYGSGVMESTTHTASVMGWAVGEVSRIKLYYASSANSIKQTAAGLATLSYDDAINGLGTVIASTPPEDNGGLYPTGSQISFDLNGGVTNFSTDAQSGLSSYSPAGSDGQEKVWIVSAAVIRARLNALNAFHLGGILVNDLLTPGNDTGIFTALSEYKGNLPSSLPTQLSLQWDISNGSGAVANQTTGIGTPMVWQADSDGSYIVRGAVIGGRNSDRGSVNLQVGAPATTPPPVVVQSSGGGSSAPPPAATTAAPPPPVTGNVMAGSGFELGGQTHGTGAFGVMQSAKMSWVKFQHKWGPGDTAGGEAGRVAAAKAAGLKVLISVPGPLYPTSIDYTSYVNFVKDLAAMGVDGIEIWNEMNLAREWPQNDISGTSYVNNMLKPAYQAIKSANPNTMVISGAPAPSGYWGGCGSGGTPDTTGCDDWAYLIQMRDAGAASYMDCMGVHFNSGATSPAAVTGHPADAGDAHYTWYYTKMYATYYGTIGKPLCFTELGYVSPEGYGNLPSNFSWGSGTSVAEQAQWLAETAVMASKSKQVRLMIVFNVDFTVWEAYDPQAGYAMVRPGGGCPACSALAGVMP